MKKQRGANPKITVENFVKVRNQLDIVFKNMSNSAAKKALSNTRAFRAKLRAVSKSFDLTVENSQLSLLEDYFNKVFGITIPELYELSIPDKENFTAMMVVPPSIDEDQIGEAISGYFKVDLYRYRNSVAQSIDRRKEQMRPSCPYIFTHSGEDEPDARHLGKSHDDALSEELNFMNPKEYLLATGFKKFTEGKFFDQKGWTRTSSLWSDSGLVVGGYYSGESRLCLGNGNRDSRGSSNGPREISL